MNTNGTSVSGRELDLILSGKKPMAAFYRVVGENFDEKDGQDFDGYVKNGRLSKINFYIKNEGQKFSIFYSVYCLKNEEWRLILYKKIKKIGQITWNEDLESLESWLLGYKKL